MKTFAVILAAGKGKRFSDSCHSEPERRGISPIKKQFVLLDNEPIWVKALRSFQNLSFISGIVVVLPAGEIESQSAQLEGGEITAWVPPGGSVGRYFPERASATAAASAGNISPHTLNTRREGKVSAILAGGERRQESVYAALSWIAEHHRADFVFIHDGVRPFVTTDLIERLWEERESGAVVPVIPISDTVKRLSSHEVPEIIETLDRSSLVRVQTPQLFSFPLIMEAFQELKRNPVEVTDDASVVERVGKSVKVIEGDPQNIKITTARDLPRVECHPEPKPSKAKAKDLVGDSSRYALGMTSVGQGIDIHPFEQSHPDLERSEGEGSQGKRKLILGGVEIPHDQGLKGHSDADVLTHAICDAILGAAGLSDLGTHFPDNDPAYKDISSLILLQNVVDKVRVNRYSIMHIDVTIMTEKPKISPFVSQMKESLCAVLNILPTQLAIKAKTGEGIGFIGREEGIVALAIATLRKETGNAKAV